LTSKTKKSESLLTTSEGYNQNALDDFMQARKYIDHIGKVQFWKQGLRRDRPASVLEMRKELGKNK